MDIKNFGDFKSTSTTNMPNWDWEYTSKDKTYYGIKKVKISLGNTTVEANAKFDTGARTSSIDFKLALKLGISNELINKCRELESVTIDKNIDKKTQKKMEREWFKKFSDYPQITSVQLSKSSSGFSLRAYIRLSISYSGRIINTEVNLRDRSGLQAEMLIGLKDML